MKGKKYHVIPRYRHPIDAKRWAPRIFHIGLRCAPLIKFHNTKLNWQYVSYVPLLKDQPNYFEMPKSDIWIQFINSVNHSVLVHCQLNEITVRKMGFRFPTRMTITNLTSFNAFLQKGEICYLTVHQHFVLLLRCNKVSTGLKGNCYCINYDGLVFVGNYMMPWR